MAEMVECALDECDNEFLKRVHNQRFCSRECCRVYTNARILAAYHAKKNKVTTGRVCKSRGCATLLSRYNEGDHCASCEKKQVRKRMESWGWELND